MDEEEAGRAFRRSLGIWYDKTKKLIAAMTGPSLTEALEGYGVKVPDGASMTWRRFRLCQAMQEERREEFGLETPEHVQKHIQTMEGYGGKVPRWFFDVFTGERPREARMAKSGAKKKTIGARMVEILRLKRVPTNAAIVEMVKKDFPDSAFNSTHVSWYKGAFMSGRLPGQTKGEKITQPEIREPKAAKPAAKKKVAKKKVAKKKVAKKKVRRSPKRKSK
jgi:hypothetical protein